jgi:hypothetical protein
VDEGVLLSSVVQNWPAPQEYVLASKLDWYDGAVATNKQIPVRFWNLGQSLCICAFPCLLLSCRTSRQQTCIDLAGANHLQTITGTR